MTRLFSPPKLCGELVELVDGDRRQRLVGDLALRLTADHQLLFEEVAHDLTRVVAAVRRRVLGLGLLVLARQVGTRAIELALRDAMALETQHLGEQRTQRVLDVVRLGLSVALERIDVAQEVVAELCARAHERGIGLAAQRRKALVDDLVVDLLGDEPLVVGQAAA